MPPPTSKKLKSGLHQTQQHQQKNQQSTIQSHHRKHVDPLRSTKPNTRISTQESAMLPSNPSASHSSYDDDEEVASKNPVNHDAATKARGHSRSKAKARTFGRAKQPPLANIVEDMVDAHRKRHKVSKSKVRNSYAETASAVRESIVSFFAEHQRQTDDLHRTQMSRLQKLMDEKAKVEREMRRLVEEQRARYANYADDLEAVVSERARQLS
ncbi:hypothetical protein BU24DRAFT_450630 [Aaosphaeria arxii CBS 175.79]|uniref:Uncharacterized protein n=1 Tax=Aaosphaeria arxii CBS 175.79 TaxID=1450172 RepID=A0A6A5XTG9_9PLEO|nr:uncharacterized protein BU24DRAFT_450630 [Aaosphaeria arxii CBS 175.79]KAF2016021.1 hypothetical protein BU24DRAFT_450630 [Aaosphaeria arxii CBS 175.79]